MIKHLSIEGMSCNHCAAHVKEALSGVSGVSKTSVDLGKKSADVEGEALDEAVLKAAVAEAGYSVVSIS
jgi:copper chaperone